MICLDFDWQIDEFMVYCRSTQLRKKRCFLMNKPCDYLRRKHILSVKTVVMCFLFLRFGLCFDEENEDVLPGRTVFAVPVPAVSQCGFCLRWLQGIVSAVADGRQCSIFHSSPYLLTHYR